MAEETTSSGVETASPAAEPATPVAPAVSEAPSVTQPTASEGVTTPEDEKKPEQSVPYSRFVEVNSAAKKAQEDAAEAKQRLEEIQQALSPKSEPEVTLDPDVEKVLEGWAKSKGYVTQEELSQERVRLQLEEDVASLKSKYQDFDPVKITEFAKENGIGLNSKAALEATYKYMNAEKVVDEAKKQAIEESRNSEFAERPGAGGQPPAPKDDVEGGDSRSRIRSRIGNAMKKLS